MGTSLYKSFLGRLTFAFGLRGGRGSSQGLKLFCSLADPFGLDGVDPPHHLLVEFDQLGACLPEPAVGVGPFLESFELFRLGRDILWPWTAAIREDLGLMEVALGTAAVGFSAASPEGVDGPGQQSLSLEEGLCELSDMCDSADQRKDGGAWD